MVHEHNNAFWVAQHYRAATYPYEPSEAQKAAAAAYVSADAELHHCSTCRADWAVLLEQMPPDVRDKDRFFAWTVAAHNRVNAKLGKRIMSLDEARALYGLSPSGQVQSTSDSSISRAVVVGIKPKCCCADKWNVILGLAVLAVVALFVIWLISRSIKPKVKANPSAMLAAPIATWVS